MKSLVVSMLLVLSLIGITPTAPVIDNGGNGGGFTTMGHGIGA